MERSSSIPKSIVEFTTVAMPVCQLLYQASQETKEHFIDKLLHLLPLLYLKSIDVYSFDNMSEEETSEDAYWLHEVVSESEYTHVARGIESLLGNDDLFLEALSPDMAYSDVPLTARISEYLADIYQPIGNFLGILHEEDDLLLPIAALQLSRLFAEYWGDRLLAVVRALHHIRYTIQEDDENIL